MGHLFLLKYVKKQMEGKLLLLITIAIVVLCVSRLPQGQPDHAFEFSTTIKVITMQILWPSSSLRKVCDPVTRELRNHFDAEYHSSRFKLTMARTSDHNDQNTKAKAYQNLKELHELWLEPLSNGY